MATVKWEVIAKAGTYTKDGEEKQKWHKCGVVFESDKGLSLKLESLPIGFDGWLNLWEPKQKDEKAPKQDAPAKGPFKPDGDIPF